MSGGLALGGLGLSETGIESARADTTVVDDFEDGDLSEYSFDRGESGASVASSPAHSGSYALEFSNTITEAISTSGLNAYPSAGDTFSFWVRASGGGDNLNVTWGVQDHDNRYYAKLYPDQGKFYLFTYKSASGSSEASDSGLSLSQDAWYEIEVDWATDGTQTVTLYDSNGTQLSQLSMTDSTWSSGGIGYDAYLSSGESVYFDYVTLEDSGGPSPPDGPVIDDFEDGDLNEYSTSNNSVTEIVDSPTYSGNYVAKLERGTGESGRPATIRSTSGLENYPEAGDRFSVWIQPGLRLKVYYGVQDDSNQYYYVHLHDNGVCPDCSPEYRFTFFINLWEDGDIAWSGGDVFDRDSSLFSGDDWFELEVTWGNQGTHQARLYDENGNQIYEVTASSDETLKRGGIGFFASQGTTYVDHAVKHTTAVRQLGSFENGLDGWTTTESNSLSQVSGNQQPAPVTEGDHALEVAVNSDSEPTIQNESRVQNAALESNPCLLADVLPSSVENSDSPVTFRFRYHHSDPGGVEESHEMTVDQQYGGRICWDMSELSSTKLANPERLEIVWYPANYPPSSGFDYTGTVFVDNVQLTADQNKVTRARCYEKHRELERSHGLMLNQVIQSQTNMTQDGVYKYSDGTEVSYQAEILDNGNLEETLDGETFRWEGGSA